MGGLFGPSPDETGFEDVANLVTGQDVPDDTFRVDRTNPLFGQGDLPSDSAEVDKALRDAGDFPERPDTVVTRQSFDGSGLEVVGQDSQGRELGTLFRGQPQEAKRVASRANQAIQQVEGQDAGITPSQPQTEAGNGQQAGSQRSVVETILANNLTGPDPLDQPQQTNEPIGTPEEEGVARIRPPTAAAESTVPREGGQGIFESILDSITPSPPSLDQQPEDTTPPEPGDAEVEEEPEQPDPQEAAERAAPQGATAQDVAELIDPVSDRVQEVPSAGGGEITPSEVERRLIQSAQQQGEAPPTEQQFSEEQLQQAREQAPENFGRLSEVEQILGQIQGGVEQAGEFLNQPEVQRGLGQLAQLFVQPDSGTAQAAQRLINQANQEIRAQEIQGLIEGEDVEATSPGAVQTAEDVKAQRAQTDVQEDQLDVQEMNAQTRRMRARLAVFKALNNTEEKPADISASEFNTVLEGVADDFAARIRSGNLDGVNDDMLGTLNRLERQGTNVDPLTVRSMLGEESRRQFDQFLLQQAEAAFPNASEERLRGFIGSVGQNLDEQAGVGGGEGRQSFDLSSDETSFQQIAQNASAGDVIRVPQDTELPSGRTIRAGQHRVQSDGSLQRIDQ